MNLKIATSNKWYNVNDNNAGTNNCYYDEKINS